MEQLLNILNCGVFVEISLLSFVVIIRVFYWDHLLQIRFRHYLIDKLYLFIQRGNQKYFLGVLTAQNCQQTFFQFQILANLYKDYDVFEVWDSRAVNLYQKVEETNIVVKHGEQKPIEMVSALKEKLDDLLLLNDALVLKSHDDSFLSKNFFILHR